MGLLKPRFKKPALEAKNAFRNALADWFDTVGKDYPWRRTREPYPVLVSEVMLQQTRISTVLGKGFYTRFLEKFPDVHTLSEASDEALLKAWEGLGYYRRARMLRETARAVITNHSGIFPANEKDLLALPGIGPYTAAALLAFSFGKTSPLVDGNVSRVLSRLMDDPSEINSTPTIKRHRLWAAELCDPANPARHHHAMMELGQTLCRTGMPLCEQCPVATFCKTDTPENLPVSKPRAKLTEITEHALWHRDSAGNVLLHHESGTRRTGLWKLPLRTADQCSALDLLFQQTYHITRYKVRLLIHAANHSSPEPGDEWIAPQRLAELPMPTPFRNALERLLADFRNGMWRKPPIVLPSVQMDRILLKLAALLSCTFAISCAPLEHAPPASPEIPGAMAKQIVMERLSAVVVTGRDDLGNWINNRFSIAKAPNDADGGSAAPITEDGYFLTADHVLARSANRNVFVIYGRGGRILTSKARIIWRSQGDDLAILHIPSKTPYFYNWTPPQRWLSTGHGVIHGGMATGFRSEPGKLRTPLSPESSFTRNRRFKIDIPLQPGDSGGPVVDARGNLIGINSAVEYLIPLETAIFIDSEGNRPNTGKIAGIIQRDRNQRNSR